MSMNRSGRLAWMGAGVLVLAAAAAWQFLRPAPDDGSFVRGNGRIEATEVDVAAKAPGRVDEILVNEGDFVTQDSVVARMDVKALQAQLAQARAEVANAVSARETARALVAQRHADVAMAEAVLVQRRADLDVARSTAARSRALLADRATSAQKVEDDAARARSAEDAGAATSKAGQRSIGSVMSSPLQPRHGFNAGLESVLDQSHVSHRIGNSDQSLRCRTAGDDHMLQRRPRRQRRDNQL